MGLIHSIKKLKKSWNDYKPLIEVVVYRDNILHNLKQYQTAFPKVQFAPVLKSNAYGHGLVEMAKILDNNRLPFFMADSLFEARNLRHEGVKTPILILGYTTADNINVAKLKNVAFGIISLEQLKNLDHKLRHQTNFHLKIDTGMRRQGLMPEELPAAVRIIKNNPKIKIEGICSHLADADGADNKFSRQQITLWNKTASELEAQTGPLKYKHLANSAGADFTAEINANVSRLGIGLYGYNLSPRAGLALKPALEMRSIISSIKILSLRESIGYNVTFTAKQQLTVATVPVGYTEGLDRRLSNAGAMTVDGIPCPIVGRVSMNITSIDVSKVQGAHLDQAVTIISSRGGDPNSVENIAKLCNTIPYEILVRIPGYLKRVIE